MPLICGLLFECMAIYFAMPIVAVILFGFAGMMAGNHLRQRISITIERDDGL
jgi:hypothetical protein